jgi:hypothetical protein
MQQSLSQINAASQAARKSLHVIAGPIGDAEAFKYFIDALMQGYAGQAVQVALMNQIFAHGERREDAPPARLAFCASCAGPVCEAEVLEMF